MYCDNCGSQLNPNARFCSHCGSMAQNVHSQNRTAQNTPANVSSKQQRSNQPNRRLTNADVAFSQPKMTIGKAISSYFACVFIEIFMIVLSALVCALTDSDFPMLLILVSYASAGVFLNRVVLRGLIKWHPVYNTLENVSYGKLDFLVFWPLRYPILFFQIIVNRHL